jgi:hypothetical protein
MLDSWLGEYGKTNLAKTEFLYATARLVELCP